MFRRKNADAEVEWDRATAEVLSWKSGFQHERGAGQGIGGGFATTASDTTYQLTIEPGNGASYQASLKIGWREPATSKPPMIPGTRFEVLVDKSDPQHLSLPTNASFALPGGQAYAPTQGLAGELRAAAQRGDGAEVARLSALLRAQQAAAPAGSPLPGTAGGSAAQPAESQLDRLAKLGQLRDSGVLTEEEFQEQKARILAEG
jgi:hypothetical protein